MIKGLQEGLEKGLEQGREESVLTIARNMKFAHIAIDVIQQVIRLSFLNHHRNR